MPIDEFMPVYDFSERHETKIRASRERVFEAVNSADLTDSRIIRGLFALRGPGWSRAAGKTTVRDMTKDGFAVLGENPNEEVLLDLAGKFRTLSGNLQKTTPGNFKRLTKKVSPKRSGTFRSTDTKAERR